MSGRRYLRIVRMDAFGAFSAKTVGPFGPGLNIVCGRNEAGKSTVASFVGGVLFGWDDARSRRNTYKPAAAAQAGALLFAQVDGERSDDAELFRSRNVEGLQGPVELVADIDKDTYRTMFSLTSDELRGLRNTPDMTAKLLTAGSGTETGPAQALAAVQERLAECLSRAAAFPDSIPNLKAEADRLKAAIAQASQEANRLKTSERELCELEPQQEKVASLLKEAQSDIALLTSSLERLRTVGERMARDEESLKDYEADEKRLAEEVRAAEAAAADFAGLDEAGGEQLVREALDRYGAEQTKRQHAVDAARERYLASTAKLEALRESEEGRAAERRDRQNRILQVAISILMPALFLLVGLGIFMDGHTRSTLSMVALGSVFMVFAAIMAFAALYLLLRPPDRKGAERDRWENAEWVMLQDKKMLLTCEEDRDAFAAQVSGYLDRAGLSAARGSVGQARSLLDAYGRDRETVRGLQQRLQAIRSQYRKTADDLASAQQAQEQVYARLGQRLGVGMERSVDGVERALFRKEEERAAYQERSDQQNQLLGRLAQELRQGETRRELDELKLSFELVSTRQAEAARELARLLMAQRMLQSAISAWESTSQPEVYRKASALFSLMTDGKWERVALGPDGSLLATNAAHVTLPPAKLSLSTCQQLYLSLRIALLMSAEGVGSAIPVLADDILVNFDEKRRAGAAAALAELAKVRQVIVFTCHGDVAEALKAADPAAREVDL